ncbi:MAG: ABC transporter ATP-binding protein [Lachnospiraceae bacterium]
MKKLLIYLKDYKIESILAPLFKMLEASFELIVPLVVTAMIDVGIADRDKGYIIKMCLIMVLLGLIGLICSVTAQYFAARAAVGFGTKLRHHLFSHIQTFSFSEMDKVGTATLITRMTSDSNQVQSGVNMVLRLLLRSPFIVFGAMIMAFTIHVKAAVIFVITIPLLSIVVFGIMGVTIPLYKKVQERLDKVLGITRENLTGIRVIRAFHKEQEEKVQFQKNLFSLSSMQNKVGRISAFMNPVTYVIINGGIVALLYTGAFQVDSGMLTQGELVALVNYMSQILVELIKLANLIVLITKAVACGNRISSVLEMQSSMPLENMWNSKKNTQDKQKKDTPILEFSQVGLKYQNAGGESLTDINFTVQKGETIGIIGGTGCGKTSLVHLIPRFYDATSGEVRIYGKNVKEYPLKELRKMIGIVMQKAVLFRGTIRENLCWGKEDATQEEIQAALKTAQALEIVEEKDGKLEAFVDQGGKNLSGGQRQRLTIARALLGKPEILILDDSASALDYATDARLRKAIEQMQEQPTVIIVSQRTSSIQHADKIIVLEDGGIAGIASHEELLRTCEVYREIYESQYKKQEGGAKS